MVANDDEEAIALGAIVVDDIRCMQCTKASGYGYLYSGALCDV